MWHKLIQTALNRQNYDDAARQLVDVVSGAQEQRVEQINALLAQFPRKLLDNHPDLLLIQALQALHAERLDQALPLLQRASLFYLQRQAVEQALNCYYHLISLYQRWENFPMASVYVEEARKLLEQVTNAEHQAKLTLRLAELCPDIGRLRDGLSYAQQALDHFRFSEQILEHFQALRFLSLIERQLGEYAMAEAHLAMARQLTYTGAIGMGAQTTLLNAAAHLAWYRGNLTEAQTIVTAYEQLVQQQELGKQEIYAVTLRGNLQRAQQEYTKALQTYQAAHDLVHRYQYTRYLPWLTVQESWCYLLMGDLREARARLQQALDHADYGQMMSFNIPLAIYHLLSEQYFVAHDLLAASLEYYERSGDTLTIRILHWYLAFIAMQSDKPDVAQTLLQPVFKWMTEQGVTYFPLWWHPTLAAEICTWALQNGINPVMVNRILTQQIGKAALAAVPSPRAASITGESTELRQDPMIRERMASLFPPLPVDCTIDLGYIRDDQVKRTIEELLQGNQLLRTGFAQLQKTLTTANHQQRPNPVLIAVFGLYLHDYPTAAIADKLGRSQPSVRNYITTIYQIFDLPRQQFSSPLLRKRQLAAMARRHGFINGGGQ
ncbi:MAG TPA: hypothetical protein P5121_17370 [Caldilineaceae bacterium]|nr:hypothetical protein [Caldilineaceae bacterium]